MDSEAPRDSSGSINVVPGRRRESAIREDSSSGAIIANHSYPPISGYAAPYFVQAPIMVAPAAPAALPMPYYFNPARPVQSGNGMLIYRGQADITLGGGYPPRIACQDSRKALWTEYAEEKEEVFGYQGPEATISELKKSNLNRQNSFNERMTFWDANRLVPESQFHQNSKLDATADPPMYPGVEIDEIGSSASQCGTQPAIQARHYKEAQLGLEPPAVSEKKESGWRQKTPMNTIMMFVPEQESWVVERMGKFHKILEPGMNMLIPLVDKVKYVHSKKEVVIEIPQQSILTCDNVSVSVKVVVYLKVQDPYKASYAVEDPEFAFNQLAHTSLMAHVGSMDLDQLLQQRQRNAIGPVVMQAINDIAQSWGLVCTRYDINDLQIPQRILNLMQLQAEAERRKRAAIVESEGIKEAEMNMAEGKKEARIMASEAEKIELINAGQCQAETVLATSKARADSIKAVAMALESSLGQDAANFILAEKYVSAFQEMAKASNTLILPANVGDVSQMVTQALSFHNRISHQPSKPVLPVQTPIESHEVKSQSETSNGHDES